jgi:LysR family transcriptional regulator, hypochlorite-specific transcription factor HypT
MQLKWLEDFIALSETRNFTRAAELRHVTHPAFGRRIRSLEQWVGVALVDRARFPATLTREGEAFVDVARACVMGLRAGRDAINTSGQGASDVVRVATGTTLGHTHFPEWLTRTQAQVGPFQSSVFTGSLHEAIERLTEGHADFVVAYGHPQLMVDLDAARFAVKVIARERLVAVSAPRVAFALPGSAKRPVPYLQLAPALAMAKIVEARLRASPRLHVRAVHVADSAQTIRQFAIAGLGVTWLPEAIVREDIRTKKLVLLGSAYDLPLDIRLYRASHGSRPLIDAIWRASD